MNIGVIGVGIIASYMVTGFCESGDNKFFLSPRNAEKSAELKGKYPEKITIAGDNQEVLDKSEVVILAVLPELAEGILSSLAFRSDHKIISVIPIIGLPRIKDIIGETEILVDVLPLPFIAKNIGPLAIYPPHTEMVELLKPLGDLVAVDTAQEMSVIRTTTALMSPYYELIAHVVDWCGEKGLGEDKSKAYVTSFFSALSRLASETEEGALKELAQEMTPGGLNWQATSFLKDSGSFVDWQKALDPVFDRVTGK